MEKNHFLKRSLISFIILILVASIVTQVLQNKIFFSAFLGIPAGIIAFLISFIYQNYKSSDD